MVPTLVFWPGEFHGLYSPWGCKESDTAEWFHSLKVLLLSMFLRLYPSVHLSILYYIHSIYCTRYYKSSQLHTKFHHTGSLKSALVGVFPLWKKENTTNWGFTFSQSQLLVIYWSASGFVSLQPNIFLIDASLRVFNAACPKRRATTCQLKLYL